MDEYHQAGRHELVWDGCDQAGRQVTSGTYFFRVLTASGTLAQKGVLLR